MSNESPVLTSLSENSTDVPVTAGQAENYVLLLVLLSAFAGGTLVLLSLLLLFCHRCCMGGRRYSRASDDPEKTNTTYVEDSQPTQEITIHLDESDALSAGSCHDGESERFVSTGSTGRRVSFNESALYEQEKTTEDKGRRYTLTEGDFHHLKKARLTHLALPPGPCDLKILTIMECDSTESSTVSINDMAAPKLPLTIYQPTERRVPDWVGLRLSRGLPGDQHHSAILDRSHRQTSSAINAQQAWSHTMEAIGDTGEAQRERGMRGESAQAPGQTSVLHFFTKLRRHASLEGSGPYFRRWKFDSSHRAASLDAKGSPKRRPFQRQRAASETTDHTDNDSLSLQDEVIDSFLQSPIPTSGLQSLSAESLSQRETALTSSIFLSSLKPEVVGEFNGSCDAREDLRLPTNDCCAQRKEEASANGTRVEEGTKFGAGTGSEAVEVELESVEDDDLFVVQQGAGEPERFEDKITNVRKTDEADEGDELALGGGRLRAGSGSSFSFLNRQESSEAPQSLYRDIWSLRASLEQYASSDQSSTDRESIRSDGDSGSSHGGAGARSGLDSCLSQDLDDEPEGEGEGEAGTRGASGGDREVGSGAGGDGEAGNRKLLQMDSGYTSIEAPSRPLDEMRLFGTPGAPRGKTASERRLFFTSSGRKGSVCESTEARLLHEELRDEMAHGAEEKLKHRSQTAGQSITFQEPHQLLKILQPPESQSQFLSQLIKPIPQASTPHKPRLRRRDYSIDEKTDALFNEFLRHDPRFDQQDPPLRSRHRSRVHLRKQWQRHKQYSDPGSGAGGRYSPSLERQRFTPLRRGDSAGYPLDTRYHSTLSRIASAADEEACEVAPGEEPAKESSDGPSSGGGAEKAAESTRKGVESRAGQSLSSTRGSHADPTVTNRNNNSSRAVRSERGLADKMAASVEERLYGGLGAAERALTVSHAASAGFSPM
ncbi:voltage-dependent calcium channel beta subunit-associated regulatory protein isoform 1-T3 [Spinachia spinachia]